MSSETDVRPLRSMGELRAEVSRRAARVRRRRALAIAPAVLLVAVGIGYAVAENPTNVDVKTVRPADQPGVDSGGPKDPAAPANSGRNGDTGNKKPSSSDKSGRQGASGVQRHGANPTSGAGSGGTVVFVSDRGGTAQVYSMSASAPQTARRLTSDTSAVERPALSADGSQIAYVSRVGPAAAPTSVRIKVIRADGSDPRTLPVEGAIDPAWSPDGTRLAFSSSSHIWVVNADGTGATQLTNVDRAGDANPTWSPDGSSIAFRRFDSRGVGAIVVMRSDGSDSHAIYSGVAAAPAWSPDGRLIAFVRLEANSSHIAVMRSDGSGLTVITSGSAWDGRPTWTPDGRSLIFDRDQDGHSAPGCYIGFAGGQPVRECMPSSDGPAKAALWTVVVDGSGVVSLTTSSSNDFDANTGR